MSSSTKIDNRKKDILILGKGPTQRPLSLYNNKENSYSFINGTKINKFKSKDSENLHIHYV